MWKTDDGRDEIRSLVLDEAFKHIPFEGWTDRVLRSAAEAHDIPRSELRRLFPGGARDLLQFSSMRGDLELAETLQNADLEAMRIRERVTFGVRTRLEFMADHKEAARRAALFLALPPNGLLASKLIYRTVDTIWHGIGDTSTDFNFYSKRAILSGVYSSSFLYWMTDESEQSERTWEFLDRRIADVMQIEKVKAQARKVGEKLPNPLSVLGALRYPGRS